MSTDDKRTKAQLIEEVGALKVKVIEWESYAEKQNAAQKQAQPVPVYEADALRGCIRALDVLWPAEDRGRMTGKAAIGRLLRLLAAKYDVPLVEVQVRDCTRRHVDEIQQHEMWNAIQGALR